MLRNLCDTYERLPQLGLQARQSEHVGRNREVNRLIAKWFCCSHVMLTAGERPPASLVVRAAARLQEFISIGVPVDRTSDVHLAVPVRVPSLTAEPLF